MQVSEQTDSLRVLGTDPVDYLVSPRVLACMIAGPVLNILCFAMGELKLFCCQLCCPSCLGCQTLPRINFCSKLAVLLRSNSGGCLLCSGSISEHAALLGAVRSLLQPSLRACIAGWLDRQMQSCFEATESTHAVVGSITVCCVFRPDAKKLVHVLQAWLPVLVWQRQCMVFRPMSYWTQPAEPLHLGIL